MGRLLDITFDSFLDGVTGAGIFGWLKRPGAPTHIIDPRGLEEYKESGEYDAMLARFGLVDPVHKPGPATRFYV